MKVHAKETQASTWNRIPRLVVGRKEEVVLVGPILETCMGLKERKLILDLLKSIYHRDLRQRGT